MSLLFTPSPDMTIGVELELQIVDPATKDLTPKAPELFERLEEHGTRFKPELFRAMLEVNTGVCRDLADVRSSLANALAILQEAGDAVGVQLASAGSHPFARHVDRLVYPAERYQSLIDRNRWLARRLMIFGLHVHVGMRDGGHAAAMINAILPYLPHLLALSASSPYWQGSDTGLTSCRITIFEALPTAGHPCTFKDWSAFESTYEAMIASRAIGSIKDLWWDIRPHPDFGTVEVRVCDGLPTLSETMAVVGLTVALFTWLDEQYRKGRRFAPPPYWLLRENKWRASRWGVEADLVLDASGRTNLLRTELTRLLDTLDPVIAGIGGSRECGDLRRMLRHGLSYERQRRVFERTGSLEKVVELLTAELKTDLVS
jgi:carboxylate-amine ligase